jgi:catechol 2,3-dioxygenase-like lactoylglutathione lyase family enzyme
MARARRFYGGVLGLKEGDRWGNQWVEYAVGRQTLALSSVMKNCRPGARGGAAALETDRFDEVVGHLRRRRVKFVFGPEELETCAFARFLDPDGNHVCLHRRHRRRRRP